MNRKLFLILQGVFFSTALFAQDLKKPPFSFDQFVIDYLPWILLGVIAFLALIILGLIHQLQILFEYIPKEGFAKKANEEKQAPAQPDFISKFFQQVEAHLTNAVPIEKEKEIETKHEYDGIRELDNSLPPWWKYMFYATIVFAVVYLYRFHVSHSAPLSLDEYKNELAEAELQKEAYLQKAANLVTESSIVPLTEKADLLSGKKTYDLHCVACHGALGEGGVGPNLADEYWLHGGSIKDVFKSVKYGWPEKGMIAWQTQLRPREMQEVASYILTLQGTNPPNAKDAQGERYVLEAAVVN